MHPWKIWYDDGTTFSNEEGNPEDAPIDGVQAILQWLPLGNYNIIPSSDYYWWVWDRWVGGNINGLERFLRKRDQIIPIIIYGRWTHTNMFHQVQREVHGEIEEEQIKEKRNLDGSS